MNIEKELIEHYGCENKEDLQSYLGDFVSIEMINSFGKLCYNQAINDAADNVKEIPDSEQDLRLQYCDCINYVIDKESILKLKK